MKENKEGKQEQMEEDFILKANELVREYVRSGKFNAVDNVDFQVKKGEFISIIGPSGSGKSTFISMLAGLLKPTSGNIEIGSKKIKDLEDKELSQIRCREVSYIPQGYSLLATLTIRENIELPVHLSKMEVDSEEIDGILDKFGLKKVENSLPSAISGGERRRAVIARAMVSHPQIILADEPANDLDYDNRKIVLECFRQIADQGVAVVMVTHEDDSRQYTDRIYEMKSGKLSQYKE